MVLNPEILFSFSGTSAKILARASLKANRWRRRDAKLPVQIALRMDSGAAEGTIMVKANSNSVSGLAQALGLARAHCILNQVKEWDPCFR